MLKLILIAVLLSGCVKFGSVNSSNDLYCYQESIKYGEGDVFKERRIYKNCMILRGD